MEIKKIDKQDGYTTKVSEEQARQVFENTFDDVELVMDELKKGKTIATMFSYWEMIGAKRADEVVKLK